MTDDSPRTEVAVREKTPLPAGGAVGAIVPQDLDQMFRLATAISLSGLAPNSLQTTEKIMVAIMAGAELGMPPFQSIQSFAVINGRPTIWGDGMMAVVRSRGFTVKEWLDGEGDSLTAYCEVVRPDTEEVIQRSFSTDDAKTARLWNKKGRDGGDTPWVTYPKRMLQMRARALACRDGAADILRGFQMREEVEDYDNIRDVTPARSDLRERLEANRIRSDEGFNNVEHVLDEIEPIQHERPRRRRRTKAEMEAARAEAQPDYHPIENEEEPEPRPVSEETEAMFRATVDSSGKIVGAERIEDGPLAEPAHAAVEPSAPEAVVTPVSEPTTATEAGIEPTGDDTTDDPPEGPGRDYWLYSSTIPTALTYQEVRQALATFRRSDDFKNADPAAQRLWAKDALDRLNKLRDDGRDIPTPEGDPWVFMLAAGFMPTEQIQPAFDALKRTMAYKLLNDGQQSSLIDTVAQLTAEPPNAEYRGEG